MAIKKASPLKKAKAKAKKPINSRRKGANFEREVVKILSLTGIDAMRTSPLQAGDGTSASDVTWGGFRVECKCGSRALNIRGAYMQAAKTGGEGVPVAIVRTTGDPCPDLAVMDLDSFVSISAYCMFSYAAQEDAIHAGLDRPQLREGAKDD